MKQFDNLDPKNVKALLTEWNNFQNRSSYQSFHMFVEELEQNLFPKAQFELVKLLVGLLKQMEKKPTGYKSTVF